METPLSAEKRNKGLTAVWVMIPLVILVSLYCYGTSGNDFWWHVKVGEYICENLTVPITDIFSWWGMEHQIPWTAHEWLSEVILYAIHALTGETGVFLFCVGAALLLMATLYRLNRRDGRRNVPAMTLFFAFFAVMANSYCFGRPHLFSYFLLVFELKILFDFTENPTCRRIWLLPPLAVLWSNLHGGSSNLSYLLVVMFLIIGCFRFDLGRLHAERLDRRARRTLLLVALCCAAAIFVNPIGWRVFCYPYQSIGDSVSMNTITEWASPDAKSKVQLLLFFLPMALFSAVLLLEKEKTIRLIDFAVFAFFTFLFFRSVRFSMLWYLAAPFCLFRYLPRYEFRLPDNRFSKALTTVTLALFAVLLAAAGLRTVKTAREDGLISVALSDEAVAAVKADAPERLFNGYNYGETLIYNDIPTFYDARADLFSSCGVLGDGWDFNNLRAQYHRDEEPFSVEGIIRKYRFDAFLVSRTSSLAFYMESHPERFTRLYEDEEAVYYRLIEN